MRGEVGMKDEEVRGKGGEEGRKELIDKQVELREVMWGGRGGVEGLRGDEVLRGVEGC